MAKFNYYVHGLSGTDGEGPLLYGIAMNVPNVDAVETILESDPESGLGDDNRPSESSYVKPLGVLSRFGAPLNPSGGTEDRAKGSWMSSGPVNWSVPEGFNLIWWFYNLDDLALTTGSVMLVVAEYFGVWLRG